MYSKCTAQYTHVKLTSHSSGEFTNKRVYHTSAILSGILLKIGCLVNPLKVRVLRWGTGGCCRAHSTSADVDGACHCGSERLVLYGRCVVPHGSWRQQQACDVSGQHPVHIDRRSFSCLLSRACARPPVDRIRHHCACASSVAAHRSSLDHYCSPSHHAHERHARYISWSCLRSPNSRLPIVFVYVHDEVYCVCFVRLL